MMFLLLTFSSFHSLCFRPISRVILISVICNGLKFDLLYYSVVYLCVASTLYMYCNYMIMSGQH